jgi:hypothetical protein
MGPPENLSGSLPRCLSAVQVSELLSSRFSLLTGAGRLTGSRKTMKALDPKEAEQLVLDQMDRDPARHQGPQVIRHKLASRTGLHLTRAFCAKTHDADGFSKRDLLPNAFIGNRKSLSESTSGGLQMVMTNFMGSVFQYGPSLTTELGGG